MNSALARQAEQTLIDAAQELTPEQRLDAFLQHAQLMTALYDAGVACRLQALLHPQRPQ
jgi:hypothetical protein